MLRIKRIQTISSFSNLAKEWNELLENSNSDSVFLTWEWVFTWWKYYQSDRELFLLLIHDDAKQELIGIAPFCIKKVYLWLGQKMSCIQFLGAGEPACSEYLDIICRVGYEREVWQTILQYLTTVYRAWDSLQLQDMSETSSSRTILSTIYPDYNVSYRIENITRCPYLLLTNYNPLNQSSLQDSLNRTKKNLIKQYGLTFRTYTQPEDIEPVFMQFVDLHRKRWNQKQVRTAFNDATFYYFQKEIVTQFSKNNWLRIYTSEIKNRIIAAVYCFVYRNKTYFYQHGFDTEWQKYSPGKLTLNYAIEESFHNQNIEFDFLRGEESYKYDWANHEHENITFDLYNRNKVYYTYFAIINLLRKIKPARIIPDITHD